MRPTHSLITLTLALTLPALAQPSKPMTPPPAPAKDHAANDHAAKDHAVKATTPEFHEGTKARVDKLTAIAKEGKAKLVFLGDSIVEGWEGAGKEVWARHYAGLHAANFGIGGDRTEHILWRLDHGNLDGLNPDVIVLMIGTNNAGYRQDPPAETAAGVKAILDRLEAKFPHAKVLLLGIFPRGADASDPLRTLNVETNQIIKGFDDGTRVFYHDIGRAFTDDKGNLSKEIMPDLLHPGPEGYERWAKAIDADLKKLGVHPDPKAK